MRNRCCLACCPRAPQSEGERLSASAHVVGSFLGMYLEIWSFVLQSVHLCLVSRPFTPLQSLLLPQPSPTTPLLSASHRVFALIHVPARFVPSSGISAMTSTAPASRPSAVSDPSVGEVKRTRSILSFMNPQIVAYFVAGGIAGAASRTVVSPLERLKIIQ